MPRVVALAAALITLPSLVAAQTPPAASPTPPPTLVVGVAASAPFAYQTDASEWTGLAVALWEEVATQLGVSYTLRPIPLGDVGRALQAGEVDAALGAIAVTPEGAALHDFSQPFLVTGLGFAQRRQERLLWSAVTRALFDRRLVTVVSLILVGVLIVGVIIALVERRSHTSDFGGSMRESVSMGVWWAAVTMTTVGYGDATPKTTPGRALALVWMFVGVIAVAFLTATATSVLTIAHLRGMVERPSDLFRLRLGVTAGGAAADYLDHHHVAATSYATYDAALLALDTGAIDAVVANIPVLRAEVSHDWSGRLQVSPIVIEPVLYAVALPQGSPWTNRINRAVLAITHDERWRDTEERFLGRR